MSSPDSESARTVLRTVFMGTGEIGLPSFEHLLMRGDCQVVGVVTQPDKPAGRNRELKPSVIKIAASHAGLPVFQPTSLRHPDALAVLDAWAPDLIVVMAFGQILPKPVLDSPRLACLNLHASILPKFRGASPINAAIAAGEAETGITVMHMAEGLDTGDIVLIEPEPIKRRDTAGSLHDRLAHTASRALDRAIGALVSGTASRIPQNTALATHVGKLSRTDAFIDWTAEASEVERMIRAMNPWPVAWTTIP
ncbi:MAG: methionyl-tRNA formyltransferase, partial [Chthoniobacterales bacterium]